MTFLSDFIAVTENRGNTNGVFKIDVSLYNFTERKK